MGGVKTPGILTADDGNPVLPPAPYVDGKKIRAWWNPTALAFLGDSIWEVLSFLPLPPCLSTALCAAVNPAYLHDCPIWPYL